MCTGRSFGSLILQKIVYCWCRSYGYEGVGTIVYDMMSFEDLLDDASKW